MKKVKLNNMIMLYLRIFEEMKRKFILRNKNLKKLIFYLNKKFFFNFKLISKKNKINKLNYKKLNNTTLKIIKNHQSFNIYSK